MCLTIDLTVDRVSTDMNFKKNNDMLIAKEGNIITNLEGTFTVKLQTFANKQYTVESGIHLGL